jgi:hypothetical protein
MHRISGRDSILSRNVSQVGDTRIFSDDEEPGEMAAGPIGRNFDNKINPTE